MRDGFCKAPPTDCLFSTAFMRLTEGRVKTSSDRQESATCERSDL